MLALGARLIDWITEACATLFVRGSNGILGQSPFIPTALSRLRTEFYGTRANAEFRVRSMIHRSLKEQKANENKSTDEDRFARQDQRRYSGWSSLGAVVVIIVVIGIIIAFYSLR
jgi:hypothetical protein